MLQLCVNAQDSVAFKMQYLPRHRYDLTVSQQLKSTTTFSGNDSIMAALKEKGLSNPTVVNKEINLKVSTTTGIYDKSDKMPIQLIYLQATNGGGKTLIPPGSGLSGTVERRKMPVYDSVILTDQNDLVTKNALLQVKNLVSQIRLPTATMKLGDEYVYTVPVNIPVATTVMKMVMSITYKLTNVSDSIAGFDLMMKITFDVAENDLEKNKRGSGSGYGTMVYDRINSFPVKEEMHYTMKMDIEEKGISIKVEVKSNSSNAYVITKL